MRFRLSSSKESILELEDIVQSIAERYSIPEDRYPDVLISLTEAVNNAIRHGNKFDSSKQVVINTTYENDEISFLIADEGPGFSMELVNNPLSEDFISNPGGRGLLLMKNLSDEMSFYHNGSMVEIKFFLRD